MQVKIEPIVFSSEAAVLKFMADISGQRLQVGQDCDRCHNMKPNSRARLPIKEVCQECYELIRYAV